MDDEGPQSLFNLLVLSLGNAALVGLGYVADPELGIVRQNLEAARYNIDLLHELQKKTQGNLDRNEEEILMSMLYDLHLKYVDLKNKGLPQEEPHV